MEGRSRFCSSLPLLPRKILFQSRSVKSYGGTLHPPRSVWLSRPFWHDALIDPQSLWPPERIDSSPSCFYFNYVLTLIIRSSSSHPTSLTRAIPLPILPRLLLRARNSTFPPSAHCSAVTADPTATRTASHTLGAAATPSTSKTSQGGVAAPASPESTPS